MPSEDHWSMGIRAQGLAGLGGDAPSHTSARQAPLVWRAPEGPEGLAAVPVGGGGAWPGFEATRRAELAARTARGRAAAHRHTKQPGPTARYDGAPNRSSARSTRGAPQRRQSVSVPRKQRRQVDAPAARQLCGLGSAREAVRQVHGVRLRR